MRSSRAWSFFSAGRQLLKNQDILQTAVKTAVIRGTRSESVERFRTFDVYEIGPRNSAMCFVVYVSQFSLSPSPPPSPPLPPPPVAHSTAGLCAARKFFHFFSAERSMSDARRSFFSLIRALCCVH